MYNYGLEAVDTNMKNGYSYILLSLSIELSQSIIISKIKSQTNTAIDFLPVVDGTDHSTVRAKHVVCTFDTADGQCAAGAVDRHVAAFAHSQLGFHGSTKAQEFSGGDFNGWT